MPLPRGAEASATELEPSEYDQAMARLYSLEHVAGGVALALQAEPFAGAAPASLPG